MDNVINYNALKQVQVDQLGNRWLQDNQGFYYFWNSFNQSYQQVNLPSDLGNPPSQVLMTLDNEGNAYFLGRSGLIFEVYTWNSDNQSFDTANSLNFTGNTPSTVTSFAIDGNELWLTDGTNNIYQLTNSANSYSQQAIATSPTSFTQVTAGQENGFIWALGSNGLVYEWDGSQFNPWASSTTTSPTLQKIAVVNSSQLYGIGKDNAIYQWSVLSENFVNISPYIGDGTLQFTDIQVDENGILYGITKESAYQVLDVSNTLSLSNVNGNPSGLTTITDSQGTVHAIWNQNGQLYHGYLPQSSQTNQAGLVGASSSTNTTFLGVAPLSGGIGYPAQGSASNLSLALDETTGNVHAFWTSGSGDNEAIYHSQAQASAYGGYQWSNPTSVNTSSGQNTLSSTATTPNSTNPKSTLKVKDLSDGKVLLTQTKLGQTTHQLLDLSELAIATELPDRKFTPKGNGFIYKIDPNDFKGSSNLKLSSGLLGDSTVSIALPSEFDINVGVNGKAFPGVQKILDELFGKDKAKITITYELAGNTHSETTTGINAFSPSNSLGIQLRLEVEESLDTYITTIITLDGQGSGKWEEYTSYPQSSSLELNAELEFEVDALPMVLNDIAPGTGEALEELNRSGLVKLEAGPVIEFEFNTSLDRESTAPTGDDTYFFELYSTSGTLSDSSSLSSLAWQFQPSKVFDFIGSIFESSSSSVIELGYGTGYFIKADLGGDFIEIEAKGVQTESLITNVEKDENTLSYETKFDYTWKITADILFFNISYRQSESIVESKGNIGSFSSLRATNPNARVSTSHSPSSVNYEPPSVTHLLIKKDLGSSVIGLQEKMQDTTDSIQQTIQQDIATIIETIRSDIKSDLSDLIELLKNDLKGDITDIKNDIQKNIDDLINSYQADLTQLNQNVAQEITDIKTQIKGDITTILNDIKDHKKGIFKEIKQDLVSINQMVATDIGGLNTLIKTDLSSLLDEIKEKLIGQVITDIENDLKPDTLNEIKQQIQTTIATDISKNIEELKPIVQTDVQNVIDSVKQDVSEKLDNLLTTVEKALGISIKNSNTAVVLGAVVQDDSVVTNLDLVNSEDIAYTIGSDGSTVYGTFAGPVNDNSTNFSYLYFVQGTLNPNSDGSDVQITWNPDTVTVIANSAGANQSPSIAVDANNNLIINWEHTSISDPTVQALATTPPGNAYVVFGKSNDNTVNLGDFNNQASLSGQGFYWTLDNQYLASFGQGVAVLGDVNGQGKADFVITAPDLNQEQGGIYLIFGEDYSQVTDPSNLGNKGLFLTGQALGELGYSIHTAGDFNGDGHSDVIVGAPGLNADQGGAYILYGGTSLFSTSQPTSDLEALLTNNPSYGRSLIGQNQGDRFGTSVSGGYDLNGDGKADGAVGSPDANQGQGIVTLFFANSSSVVITNLTSTISTSPTSNALPLLDIGNSIAVIPDINKDGLADLLIGGTGAAIILFGKHVEAWPATLDLKTVSPSDGFILQNDTENSLLPLQVSSAGDVNGDGINDVIVGYGQSEDSNGNPILGNSYVFFGGSQLSSTTDNQLGFSELNGKNGFSIQGAGGTVASSGDINGDGVADLIVTDPFANNQAGLSYVIFGGSLNNIGTVASLDVSKIGQGVNGYTIGQSGTNQLTGTSVSSLGDINGDGKSDLLIGAPFTINQQDLTALQTNVSSTYITGSITNNQVSFNALNTFPYLSPGQSLLSLVETSQGFLALWNGNGSELKSSFWTNNQWQSPNTVYQGIGSNYDFSDISVNSTTNGISLAWIQTDTDTGVTALNQSRVI